MDPPAKLTSAQRALLHRIKEAREWYHGFDPDARFRTIFPACVREVKSSQVKVHLHG